MIDKINENTVDSDVKAIISFGSLVNIDGSENKGDEFSDLDLFVFTKTPEKYLNPDNIAWLTCFGKPISVLVIQNPIENNMITRIMFENLFCLDVIPISFDKFKMVKTYMFFKRLGLHKLIPNNETIERELQTFSIYLDRGYAVLYDRENMKDMLQKVAIQFPAPEDKPLTKTLFFECYDEFWQTAYRFLGKIVRDDMYYGIILLDNVFKKRLIQMIEWEEKYVHQNTKDLLFYGKGIKNWGQNSVIVELKKTTFSLGNKEQNMEVLMSHIRLFQKLSKKIAETKGYTLNPVLESKITEKMMSYS